MNGSKNTEFPPNKLFPPPKSEPNHVQTKADPRGRLTVSWYIAASCKHQNWLGVRAADSLEKSTLFPFLMRCLRRCNAWQSWFSSFTFTTCFPWALVTHNSPQQSTGGYWTAVSANYARHRSCFPTSIAYGLTQPIQSTRGGSASAYRGRDACSPATCEQPQAMFYMVPMFRHSVQIPR